MSLFLRYLPHNATHARCRACKRLVLRDDVAARRLHEATACGTLDVMPTAPEPSIEQPDGTRRDDTIWPELLGHDKLPSDTSIDDVIARRAPDTPEAGSLPFGL
jgi:hypothetical protein